VDILTALGDEASGRTTRPCKIQRWLDGIPDETPGKAELAATFSDPSPTVGALPTARHPRPTGPETSVKTIGDHRAGRCRCRV